MPTKNKFFCFLLFKGTFTSVFKDKKLKKGNKIVGIVGFSYFFAS